MSDSRNLRPDRIRQAKDGQGGMTLLELLIALSVLSIGMLGATGMILAGIQSNTRNKTDTTAVVLDQQILEEFATLNTYPTSGTVTIYDCALLAGNANQHKANLVSGTQALGGAGATLYTTANAPFPANVGDINWTVAAPALATSATTGYAMQYQTCNGDLYEVRWNVMAVDTTGSGASRISLLTVSARQVTAKNSNLSVLFSNPTTLRTLVEASGL
jgi:prepilin-type N-terminal cleavage/methylation domain-containing protein